MYLYQKVYIISFNRRQQPNVRARDVSDRKTSYFISLGLHPIIIPYIASLSIDLFG